jgi:hypothetical protein
MQLQGMRKLGVVPAEEPVAPAPEPQPETPAPEPQPAESESVDSDE